MGRANTTRVCSRDGVQLFELLVDARVPFDLRTAVPYVDMWSCVVCGGAGVMPAWAIGG